MNKFKVGQKVMIIKTGKLGRIMQIHGEDFDNDGATSLVYGVKLDYNNLNKLYTVHDLEETEDTLTAKEREYLSNIIKPFRDRVNLIRKSSSKLADDIYYKVIEISIKSLIPYWENEVIVLPAFKSNLYSDMEIGKEYTLEELGL